MALNLAPTLNQAKVIKRHMNCDVSEQWTDPCEAKDVTKKRKLLNIQCVEIVFMLVCERHRKLGAIKEMGLRDTDQEKECY